MRISSSRTVGVVVAVCASAATIRPAIPQDAGIEGLVQSFGIASSLRVNDNFGLDEPSPGTTTLWDNDLSYGLLRNTAVDRLALGLSGTFRFSNIPQESNEFEFDSPTARLNYGRTGANSLLGLNMRYSEIDLNFENPLRRINEDFEDDPDDDLILDDGTRKTTRARFEFETGTDDPFGAGLSSGYFRTDYTDTTDPNLFDTRTISNQVFGRFNFSPVLEGRLTYTQDDYDAEDPEGTKRTTKDTNFSLTYDMDPTTVLSAAIGYTDIDETEEFGSDTRESGVTGNLGLIRDLPNGSAGVSLGSVFSINGRRNSVLFERDLDLPLGEFEAGLGITRGPLGETNPFGNLQYVHERSLTRLTIGFDRTYRTNNRSDETRRTRAFLDYDIRINALSFVTFNLNYASVSSIGDGSAEDNKIGTFRTEYVRDLTADWDLTLGYQYTDYESERDPRTQSNEVFFTISRLFTTR